ncbi:MAG: Ig-like domain-containing protein [Ruminococcus sp.]|nr:Ig-like domain-containing protein [Ruminococcus sp.]
MKKTIGILLSILIVFGAITIFSSSAVTVKDKTLRAYTKHSFTLNKSESKKYLCKTTNNKKNNIAVTFKDNGDTYSLTTVAKKTTSGKKPVVTIYYKNSENKTVNVKKFRYKVTPLGTVNFRNIKINVDYTEKVTLSNPFVREYKFKASKPGIVKILKNYSKNGKKRTYSIKALKAGTTAIKVYLKGTSKKVGSFKITAGDFKTAIIPKYKTRKIVYNSHGSSTYMEDSHFNISDMLRYKKAGASYSATSANEDVVSVVSSRIVYSTGKGTTAVKITQKLNGKKTTVGKFKVKVTTAAMAYVAKQNALFYDNAIFGHGDNTEFLDLTKTKTVSLKPVIVKRLINNSLTSSGFKSSEYKITFTSTNSKAAKVSSTGKVTAIKAGSARIYYTIKFKDKSKYKHFCKIIVE